jgi:ureidoglycolate hydrolase
VSTIQYTHEIWHHPMIIRNPRVCCREVRIY